MEFLSSVYLLLFVVIEGAVQTFQENLVSDDVLNYRTNSEGFLSAELHDVPRFRREVKPKLKLIDEVECKMDIMRLCTNLPPDSLDLYVLECLQSVKVSDLSRISEKCQHVLWTHSVALISDDNVKESVKDYCQNDELQICELKESIKNQPYLGCLIDQKDAMKTDNCKAFIESMEWVAFSDFRLLQNFTKDCKEDIDKLQCGRLQLSGTLSQGKTLACLQRNINEINLNPECRKEILRLSELQADDVKLDRQLFLACAEDHRRFCADVHQGSGRVYKCLMQHKMDQLMSKQCQDELTRRQRLIAADYKVSKGLAKSCREDIRKNHCRRAVSSDKDIRLAQILLCLEGILRNGTKLAPECKIEMIEHRKMLMEDYQLSPEVVADCNEDIKNFCEGLETGGKTIHCLMEHARVRRRKNSIHPMCRRALESLIKEADVGEDWQVDPVLREECKPVVDAACKEVRGGDARVMSCLMDKIGTAFMTQSCETALLQIQYFVARDFKLDPQLSRECHEDAVRLCHAKRNWADSDGQMDPERGPLVLPCLYRYAYNSNENMKLKRECVDEIRRIMRQRSVSVDLQPEVEETCLDELATLCSDKTGRGEEMACLQDHLDDDKLMSPSCKAAVSNFTEVQGEHVELNPIIMTFCPKVIEKHCDDITGKDGDIMECLIEHKNEADVRSNYKCKAAIEHFQLISLKDYHFTYKFKEACRPSVLRYCPGIKTKSDVIFCLSEIVRNDTLKDNRPNIPKDCRQQLKAQLFQMRENIDLDPTLKANCKEDIENLCSKTPRGASQTLECLQANKAQLTKRCHKAIFNVEKQELLDNSVDYTLITTCKPMIRVYCHEEDQSAVLNCLKRYKDEPGFDNSCKIIVVRRMIEQNSDYRFNPVLQHACRADISKFCAEIVAKEQKEEELNGKVLGCLKTMFRKDRLSNNCKNQVTVVLTEAAMNYKLDPLLAALCKDEIQTICNITDDDGGNVVECLKTSLLEHKIRSKPCISEVAQLIVTAKADIHLDPQLYKACSVDVSKFCSDIPQGDGRHIQCLQNVLQDPNKSLQQNCKRILLTRLEMYNVGEHLSLETFGQLYASVSQSPSKKYFLLVIFSLVGVIFMMGISCGRFSRRAMMMKNK